ncbi:DUF2809 domain-containing protein [Algibacter sp. L4_22]|uniref:ribosomal maturation YjgA family protein n=1 Tax=Algibacter sp. L4_22 TaxID=2942477 RepID=UPI00201B4CA8|nr:DUF2809 domain-containing protein [Algibacter sp. L4_22]MCL5129987.1 DUF2809 domain-containing protein [Algibacter sp. L4_22]
MTYKLNKISLTLAVLLLLTEILIALYFKTGFIRYTVGDFLSTILLYCFFKSFLKINHFKLGAVVLFIAFLIEFAQYFNLLKLLNLEDHKLLTIILGSTFQVGDLVAYTFGIITVLIIEQLNSKPHELY